MANSFIIDHAADNKHTPPPFQAFPAWWYGPNGEAEIFQSEDEIPEGWVATPAEVGGKKAKTAPAAPVVSAYKDKTDAEIVALAKERKIEFGSTWPRAKVEAALIEDDKKKG